MTVCPDPQFEYDYVNGWWCFCTQCGRPAWTHEQADPLQDIRNVIAGVHAPPVMRSLDGQ